MNILSQLGVTSFFLVANVTTLYAANISNNFIASQNKEISTVLELYLDEINREMKNLNEELRFNKKSRGPSATFKKMRAYALLQIRQEVEQEIARLHKPYETSNANFLPLVLAKDDGNKLLAKRTLLFTREKALGKHQEIPMSHLFICALGISAACLPAAIALEQGSKVNNDFLPEKAAGQKQNHNNMSNEIFDASNGTCPLVASNDQIQPAHLPHREASPVFPFHATKFSSMLHGLSKHDPDARPPELLLGQISSLYQNIKKVNAGSESAIFTAQLLHNREGLSKGTTVALRVRLSSARYRIIPADLKAHAHLQVLRESRITNYIPQIYGAFFTPFEEALRMQSYFPESPLFVSESDYLETDYDTEFGPDGDRPRSPRVAFEEIIGEWALQRIAGARITDLDGQVWRHFMLTHDPSYAVYHIGDKDYVLSPGLSPRKVDYDTYSPFEANSCETLSFRRYVKSLPSYLQREVITDVDMKTILEKIPTHGLFNSMKENLVSFEAQNNPIPAGAPVTHFYISSQYFNDEEDCQQN